MSADTQLTAFAAEYEMTPAAAQALLDELRAQVLEAVTVALVLHGE